MSANTSPEANNRKVLQNYIQINVISPNLYCKKTYNIVYKHRNIYGAVGDFFDDLISSSNFGANAKVKAFSYIYRLFLNNKINLFVFFLIQLKHES